MVKQVVKEECQARINACDPHLKQIVLTAFNTGMRKGEILSLKWEDVDLKHRVICKGCRHMDSTLNALPTAQKRHNFSVQVDSGSAKCVTL